VTPRIYRLPGSLAYDMGVVSGGSFDGWLVRIENGRWRLVEILHQTSAPPVIDGMARQRAK